MWHSVNLLIHCILLYFSIFCDLPSSHTAKVLCDSGPDQYQSIEGNLARLTYRRYRASQRTFIWKIQSLILTTQ